MTATAAAEADGAVLALVGVLLGDGQEDRGLMSHIVRGERHLEMCQIGMYTTPNSRLTNGDPCSARCQRAHAALSLAATYLRAHEVVAPRQFALLEGVAG